MSRGTRLRGEIVERDDAVERGRGRELSLARGLGGPASASVVPVRRRISGHAFRSKGTFLRAV